MKVAAALAILLAVSTAPVANVHKHNQTTLAAASDVTGMTIGGTLSTFKPLIQKCSPHCGGG